MKSDKRCLIIFSSGQDSTTCLGWALNRYKEVECISFFYGQNHQIEIEQSKKICEKLNVKQTIIDISFLNTIVDSALTSGGDVNQKHSRLKELPASFVPNRNALFITLAHAYAQKIGAETLVTGVCETDFSGYYDCRMVFINSIQDSLNYGSFGSTNDERCINILTPLMQLNKAQTFQLAEDEGILDIVINDSHTCYNNDHYTKHDWGYGCSDCPACLLRQNGYEMYLNNKKQ
jgi:7-cyano-7-deazaguanine synthase